MERNLFLELRLFGPVTKDGWTTMQRFIKWIFMIGSVLCKEFCCRGGIAIFPCTSERFKPCFEGRIIHLSLLLSSCEVRRYATIITYRQICYIKQRVSYILYDGTGFL